MKQTKAQKNFMKVFIAFLLICMVTAIMAVRPALADQPVDEHGCKVNSEVWNATTGQCDKKNDQPTAGATTAATNDVEPTKDCKDNNDPDGGNPDDEDCNNGSGNDDDCEDDNNGQGVPGHCKTKEPTSTNAPAATPTNIPSSSTPIPPTETLAPPTATEVVVTNTNQPVDTNTPVPNTNTPVNTAVSTATTESTLAPTATPTLIPTGPAASKEHRKNPTSLCFETQVLAFTQIDPNTDTDLWVGYLRGNNPVPEKNLTHDITSIAADPEVDGCKIVTTMKVDGETTADIYLFGVNGGMRQLTDTPGSNDTSPTFYKDTIVYVDGSNQIHQMNLDGSDDKIIGEGTSTEASQLGNLAYMNSAGVIVIDGQETPTSGSPVAWTTEGLLYLNPTDGNLWLLRGDMSTEQFSTSTDFAQKTTKPGLVGLIINSLSVNLQFLLGADGINETDVQGDEPFIWSYWGKETGW
jgi:hypothetical protein